MQKLYRMLILELITILIITYFFGGKYFLGAASLNQILLHPSQAYFNSSTTTNGVRRFLAIGNFFDSTNNAYFQDSESYLNFDFYPNPDQIVQSVTLKLRKYAASNQTNIALTAFARWTVTDPWQTIGATTTDNGDYDFDLLSWDFSDFVKTKYALTTGQNVSLAIKITVNNPGFHEGIAVCSGNFMDSVCTANFFPILETTYYPNSLGIIGQSNLPNGTIFNAITNQQTMKCSANNGCQLDLKVNYVDQPENAQLVLTLKDQTFKVNFANSSAEILTNLPDGNYLVNLFIQDGSSQLKILDNLNWLVDTVAPNPPLIIYHSDFGSRAGANFVFQADPEVTSVQVQLEDQTSTTLATQTCLSLECTIRADTNLVDGQSYHYRFWTVDLASNQSEEVSLDLSQRNELVSPQGIEITNQIISPRNQDNNYDFSLIKYNFIESITVKSLRVVDQKFQTVSNLSELVDPGVAKQNINFQFNGKLQANYLADGVYYLILDASDQYGYSIDPGLPTKVIIDNQAPQFRNLRLAN